VKSEIAIFLAVKTMLNRN